MNPNRQTWTMERRESDDFREAMHEQWAREREQNAGLVSEEKEDESEDEQC